jgi:hypothetical protein
MGRTTLVLNPGDGWKVSDDLSGMVRLPNLTGALHTGGVSCILSAV